MEEQFRRLSVFSTRARVISLMNEHRLKVKFASADAQQMAYNSNACVYSKRLAYMVSAKSFFHCQEQLAKLSASLCCGNTGGPELRVWTYYREVVVHVWVM
eukprot:1190827-Pleurochrysis_carterae.AAC.2